MADGTLVSLRESIDQKIANSGPEVRDSAIDYFANIEKKRRVDIIVAAVNTQRELEADLRKINRADQTLYDATGAVANTYYTKDRLTQISKLKDRMDKLQVATDKVLIDTPVSDDDFGKLEKAVRAAKGGKSPDDTAE